MKAALIIPALNEAEAIGPMLDELPPGLFAEIIVADNGSIDSTSAVAASRGARVVLEPRRGYGSACLRAIGEVAPNIEAVVFMDADGSDLPSEIGSLLDPIRRREADLVIGSRALGNAEPGSLNAHQRFGNRLAAFLVRLIFGHRYTDLGPFRAIRLSSLRQLGMKDPNYGWTVEMQIRALAHGLRVVEVPVSYRRRREGRSKISGTVRGSVSAGAKILWTIARLGLGGAFKRSANPASILNPQIGKR
jgi:glycosyltransferase involved in cell wall biosynthesis